MASASSFLKLVTVLAAVLGLPKANMTIMRGVGGFTFN
jgi:hypothetical protein